MRKLRSGVAAGEQEGGGIDTGQIYLYRWANNPVRAKFKGRRCRVIARGTMNSCLLEFIDNGERIVSSRNAIRRFK